MEASQADQRRAVGSVQAPVDLTTVRALLEELAAGTRHGRVIPPSERILALRGLAAHGVLPSLDKMLPVLFNLNGAPYTLYDHFPFEALFRALMPKQQVWIAGRQVSKCFAIDDDCIRLANGRTTSLRNLHVGDTVLALDSRFRYVPGVVSKIFLTGLKAVYRVRTRLGVDVRVCGEHRFRTLQGYVQTAALRVGDRLAGVRRGGKFGKTQVDPDRLILTAYLVGDGSIGVSGNFNVTSACPEVWQDAVTRGQKFQPFPVRHIDRDGTRQVNFSQKCKSPLVRWLIEDGLWGKYAWEKHLPAWVFELSRDDAARFLSALWATDGMIKNDVTKPAISYTSTSVVLARDVRNLLNKFGIPASITQVPAACNGKRCRDAYVVRVETRDGWRAFLSTFQVPGKPAVTLRDVPENNNRDTIPREVGELISRAMGPIETRGKNSLCDAGLRRKPKYHVGRRRMQAYIDHIETYRPDAPELSTLMDLHAGGVIWDEVVSVEPAGVVETGDIEVTGLSNFVLDGLDSHNSTSFASHGILLSNAIDFFKTLFVTPLYEQIRRFSTNYVRPFIDQSPVRSLWSGTNTENSVLQRSFKNMSLMLFSFALLDADRVRGISAHRVVIDEVQDMDPDHLPIIQQTLSHSPWSLTHLAGTAKTFDNPLHGLWRSSSMAEWFIPCLQPGCNTWNIPAKEYHLLEMIGPPRDDISEDRPAVVCHKCRKPIHPRMGRWIHRRPELRWTFAGYHVPQIIMPLHYGRPDKWGELLLKQQGYGNTTEAIFWNEVMGESVDEGQKLVTETELKAASVLPWRNDTKTPDPRLREIMREYKMRLLAIDWGGGGEAGVSFTTMAVLGFKADGRIDVIWGKRLLLGADHLKEAAECIHWYNYFNCDFVAHDYTGAGTVRETVMVQAGFSLDRVMAISLQRAARQDLMVYKPPTKMNHRGHYDLDKTRSLLYTCQAIRMRQLRFFQYDWQNRDNAGLIADFLALVENKAETRLAGDIYTITRNILLTDDFAQAVNLGANALWQMNDAFPDFAALAGLHSVTQPQIESAGNEDYGWEQDMNDRFFGTP